MKTTRNIKLIAWASFFSNLIFVLAFLTPFFIEKGLDSFEILSMQSIYMIFILLLEIPSGIFSDKFGRKLTLCIAFLSFIFAWMSLFYAKDFVSFIPYQILFAIGTSFISGTYESYIFEELKMNGLEHSYKEILANIESYKFIAMALSGILASIIYKFSNFYVILILTIIFSIIAAFIIFLIDSHKKIEEKNERHEKLFTLKYSINIIFKEENINLIILESIIFSWIISSFFHFNQIMLKENGFPVYLNGIYITSIFLLSAVIMKNYKGIENKFNNNYSIVILSNIVIIIGLFLLPIINNGYILASIWILMFVFRYLRNPAISNIINNNLIDETRATILSFISLIENLGGILISPVFGYIYSCTHGVYLVSYFSAIVIIMSTFLLYRSILQVSKE